MLFINRILNSLVVWIELPHEAGRIADIASVTKEKKNNQRKNI